MRSKRAAPERESDEGAWGLEDVVATWSFFVFSSSISMCDGPAPYILRDEASVCLHRRQVARQGKKRLFRMGVVCEVTGVGWVLEDANNLPLFVSSQGTAIQDDPVFVSA